MISIEIDEDIFNYLKSLAEPFADTPNTVLRRLLFTGDKPQNIASTKALPYLSRWLRSIKRRVCEFFSAKSIRWEIPHKITIPHHV